VYNNNFCDCNIVTYSMHCQVLCSQTLCSHNAGKLELPVHLCFCSMAVSWNHIHMDTESSVHVKYEVLVSFDRVIARGRARVENDVECLCVFFILVKRL
jgi:hypothetical protein